MAAAGARHLAAPLLHEGRIIWSESRRDGRSSLLSADPDGSGLREEVGAPHDVRSLVYEYGGGAVCAAPPALLFVDARDHALHRLDRGGEVSVVRPAHGDRLGDGCFDQTRGRWIGVREHSSDQGVDHGIVAVSLGSGTTRALVTGRDFYAAPRVSPDGKQLTWLAWDHPHMPWDAAELWIGEIATSGDLLHARHLFGGRDRACFQPEWDAAGRLHVIAEDGRYSCLYRFAPGGRAVNLSVVDGDHGQLSWRLGMNTYAFLEQDEIACLVCREGQTSLWHLKDESWQEVSTPFSDFVWLRGSGRLVVTRAGGPHDPAGIVAIDVGTGNWKTVRSSQAIARSLRPRLSQPRPISFRTGDHEQAHGIFYPPSSPRDTDGTGGRSPLIIHVHGGPHGQAPWALDLQVHFWTGRGFAWLDLNHRGGTGFGQRFRRRLDGEWGVVDVEDLLAAAEWAERYGGIDREAVFATGESAGAVTVLGAGLRGAVAGVAAHYGVMDLTSFVTETHKFESHYFERLIGPWPECRDRYVERSAGLHPDTYRTPTILFQGAEDRIVVPAQAERFIATLQNHGVKSELHVFKGEGHGFRRSRTIETVLNAQLRFFRSLL
jgi:dipeptidyl aminopeptidase/acylaminoacyl peptidase